MERRVMEFKQRCEITAALIGPYWLSKVPIALSKKTVRKRYANAHAALRDLRALKLDSTKYYGADVCDGRGTIIAEVE